MRPPGDEYQELGYCAMRVGREGQKTHRCCEGVCSHSQHQQRTVQTLEEGGTEVPPTRTAATDYDHVVVGAHVASLLPTFINEAGDGEEMLLRQDQGVGFWFPHP